MELCAMAVVVLLFIAVLKQFGILEPMSMEGNSEPPFSSVPFAGGQWSVGRKQHPHSRTRGRGSGGEPQPHGPPPPPGS